VRGGKLKRNRRNVWNQPSSAKICSAKNCNRRRLRNMRSAISNPSSFRGRLPPSCSPCTSLSVHFSPFPSSPFCSSFLFCIKSAAHGLGQNKFKYLWDSNLRNFRRTIHLVVDEAAQTLLLADYLVKCSIHPLIRALAPNMLCAAKKPTFVHHPLLSKSCCRNKGIPLWPFRSFFAVTSFVSSRKGKQ